MGKLNLVLLSATLLAASACTVVRIEGAKSASITRFGVLKIVPADEAPLVAYTAQGFGLVPGVNGATLGFQQETVAMAYDPNRCQTIIFRLPEGGAGAELWRRLIETNPNLCHVGEKRDEADD